MVVPRFSRDKVRRLFRSMNVTCPNRNHSASLLIFAGIILRSKLMQYQNIAMRIYPEGVTSECINRGSSSEPAWIPA